MRNIKGTKKEGGGILARCKLKGEYCIWLRDGIARIHDKVGKCKMGGLCAT